MRSSFLPKWQPEIFQISVLPSNKLPGQKSGKCLVGILGETMTKKIHPEFNLNLTDLTCLFVEFSVFLITIWKLFVEHSLELSYDWLKDVKFLVVSILDILIWYMNFTLPSSLSQDVGNQIRCKQKSCLKKLIGKQATLEDL